MNSTDNRNSAEEEENEERSVKRVCFDLPPLPGKSRTDGTKRSLAARRQLELHYPTDDFAQSPLHEHFLGEIHFNRKDEQEYCVACISPTMNEPVGNPDKSIGPETETEPEPVSLDGPCGSSPTATEHSQEEEGPRPRKYRKLIAHEKTRLKDIIGHGAVKLRIDELLLPMGLPAAVANSVFTGIRSIPASILLHGPPGCGKTKLARAIAGEARAAFFSIAPSDVLSKFVGESEASIRNVFRTAVEHALQIESKCSVVFFDEIDALGQSRGNIGSGEGEGCSRRVLAELLLQLNVIAERKFCTLRDFEGKTGDVGTDDEDYDPHSSFQPSDMLPAVTENRARIIVAGATNRLWDCDSALLRRFGMQLEVGLPTWKNRKKMLARHLTDIQHILTGYELGNLAAITEHWSGSAIETLAREAAMRPIHECLRRAAVIRRRTTKREQCGGDVSGQEDAPESPDPDTEAGNCLLEGCQKVRPVSMDDFRCAVKTLTGDDVPITNARGKTSNKQAHHRLEHYDTSSSSDDED